MYGRGLAQALVCDSFSLKPESAQQRREHGATEGRKRLPEDTERPVTWMSRHWRTEILKVAVLPVPDCDLGENTGKWGWEPWATSLSTHRTTTAPLRGEGAPGSFSDAPPPPPADHHHLSGKKWDTGTTSLLSPR